MEVVLNIGLARTGKSNLTTLEVLKAAGAAKVGVCSAEVFSSDTEPTLVCIARLTGHDSQENTRAIYKLAETLEQDCIASYARLPIANFGALIGPRAAAWGAFNPEFFIMPDGTRLAPPAAKAA